MYFIIGLDFHLASEIIIFISNIINIFITILLLLTRVW